MENCLQNFKENIKGDDESSPPKRWRCRQCSHVEESEAKFAKHLRSHLVGHRARQYRKSEKPKATEVQSKDEKLSVNTPFIKFDSLSTSQLEISQPNTVTNLMHTNYQNREICEQLVNPSLVMPSKHDDSSDHAFNYTEILNLANIPNHVAVDNGNNNNLIMELNGDSCLNLSNEKGVNLQILADEVTTNSDVNGAHMNIQNLNEENLGTITPLNLYYIDGGHYASTVQNVEITELNEGVSRDNMVIVDNSVDKTVRLIDLNGQIVSGNKFEIQSLNDGCGAKEAQEPSDRGMSVCEICQKQFRTSAYLYRHLRKHTGEFTCNYCSLSFTRKETWLTHRCPGRTRAAENNLPIIPETESRTSFECAEVDQQDPDNPESLSTEESKPKTQKSNPKKDRSVTCLVCGTSLSGNSCLKRHMLTHEKSLCYTCVYCGAVVTHRHSIRRHLRLQHPEYKHEWNNTEFVTSLQTEIKKRGAEDPLEPNKNQNTKKKKYNNRKGKDMELPTHCPKKDSLLGTTMAEDLKLDFDCQMLQSNKSNLTSNQNKEFLNNEKSITGVREDSLDLSSFTAHFDEDIGHMSFQALALPDILCKGSAGDIIKFDSKESSPIKNFNIASLLLLNPSGSKRAADLLPEATVSADQISGRNTNKTDVKFPKPKRDANIFCSPSFFSSNEIGADKVICIENYARGANSDEKSSKGIFLSPVKGERFDGKFPLMPSMPVLLCEEENADTLQKIDEFNAGMEILLCEPVPESACPQVDYRSSVLLQEEPNPSCSAGYVLEENSSMQLVDTSTDFTFYVLG